MSERLAVLFMLTLFSWSVVYIVYKIAIYAGRQIAAAMGG